jgi:YVTN family beta-propeller protein
VIDGSTNRVVATITGMTFPYGIAIDSATNKVYVSNLKGNAVSVIDGATNQVIATIAVGADPAGVRINSTANLLYVANNLGGTISVIDTTSNTVTNTFPLPNAAAPIVVALDPITNRLFVTDAVFQSVYVLDASSGALLTTITGGRVRFLEPVYVAMFKPGKTVLISDLSLSSVLEVSESSYAPVSKLKGGNGSDGITINRKTGKIYVAESGNGTVNVYSQ